jgi:hypothetical protein
MGWSTECVTNATPVSTSYMRYKFEQSCSLTLEILKYFVVVAVLGIGNQVQ